MSAAAPIAIGTAVQASEAAADTNPAERFTDAAGVQVEYAEVVANFPQVLPPGVKFPSAIPYRFGPIGTIYEEGVGEGAAYFYWQCAWMDAALTGSIPPGFVATKLDEWEGTDFYKSHFIDDLGLPTWQEEVVRPAKQTNLDPMAASYAAMCTGPLDVGGKK